MQDGPANGSHDLLLVRGTSAVCRIAHHPESIEPQSSTAFALGKFDELLVQRDGLPPETVTCPKQGIIPHDMIHYAIESTVAHRGFLSLLREGRPVAFTTTGGDVEVAAVDGPIHSGVSASGNVRIHGGHAAELQVALSGSGSFAFGGTADRVEAALNGSGDITIAHASGPVSRTLRGSGDIRIGR